jgi:hypothetical protein
MAKLRCIGALCLYVAAFQVSIWAEEAMPEKQHFLQGDIIAISTRLTTASTLCFLALLLNRRAEKSLSRRVPISHGTLIIIFWTGSKALGQPDHKAISSNHSVKQVYDCPIANNSRLKRTNMDVVFCGIGKV